MRVAITVWNERISPVFDVAQQVLLIETDPNQQTLCSLESGSVIQKLEFIRQQQTTHLICGAISWQAERLAESFGLDVQGFVAGEAEEVIQAFLAGQKLSERFAMPGCRHRRRHCRGENRSQHRRRLCQTETEQAPWGAEKATAAEETVCKAQTMAKGADADSEITNNRRGKGQCTVGKCFNK